MNFVLKLNSVHEGLFFKGINEQLQGLVLGREQDAFSAYVCQLEMGQALMKEGLFGFLVVQSRADELLLLVDVADLIGVFVEEAARDGLVGGGNGLACQVAELHAVDLVVRSRVIDFFVVVGKEAVGYMVAFNGNLTDHEKVLKVKYANDFVLMVCHYKVVGEIGKFHLGYGF